MKLLLPIEIHVAVCEFKATHRPTIAGLLLKNCVIQVSLLRAVLCGTAALHRQASTPVQQLFFQIVFKIIDNICSSNIGVSCCTQIQLEGASVGN